MKIDPSILVSFLLFFSLLIWTTISTFRSPIGALFLTEVIQLKLLMLLCIILSVVSYCILYHCLHIEYPHRIELKGDIAIAYVALYAIAYVIGASLLSAKEQPEIYMH